jgi:GAF domain/Glyoxalase/Bleomycin resistance protein/Dioxygenase superfamily
MATRSKESSALANSASFESQNNAAVCELLVSDLTKSADYYVRGLGFEWTRQSPKALDLAFGEMRVTLRQTAQRDFARSSVTVFCPDAGFLHDRLRTRGVRMIGQLTSNPFGLVNFCALDLDGNELHFSDYASCGWGRPGLGPSSSTCPFDDATIQETAERSYQALREYEIFDSLMPAAFHAFTEFAAVSFGTDRAMITLIDRNRQWFPSHYGCSHSELPLDCSVCVHVATMGTPLVIQDVKRDQRWANHPVFRSDVRFYAGVPLFAKDRVAVGAICIVHKKPKRFTRANMRALSSLATIANCMLEKMRLYAKIGKCCPEDPYASLFFNGFDHPRAP